VWSEQFQTLMPFRVSEILLVSSAYDAFVLEEDGSLSDRLFTEFSELDPYGVPRMTHVTTASAAMLLLYTRRFDMVITVVRVEDTEVSEFSRRIKLGFPDMPVLLLTFDDSDLAHFPGGKPPDTIDHTFLWTGDTRTLVAAVGLTEDSMNVEHDTRAAGVQVILVVEDRLRAYSSFLALLYSALMSQARSLIEEGLNDAHKMMRMRARPKILLANNYDEGLAAFHRHREHVLALISDVRFPQAGVDRADAGLELVRTIRQEAPELPIMIQSTEIDPRQAAELGSWALNKNDPGFADGLRRFLRDCLGFGDFVFRLPDDTVVGRASNVYDMQNVLRTVPIESVELHALRNDFSMWLRARSLFELAKEVREKKLTDVGGDAEEIRAYLIGVIQAASRQEQEGVIADFSPRQTGPSNRFVRLGRGSLGGKARSVAFLSAQIVRYGLLERFEGLETRIPKTIVIGTDVFDAFMSQFSVPELMELDDREIAARFVAHPLPAALRGDLASALRALRGPLAVRSSSVLEDSRFQPFAGVYATYMLPNNQRDPQLRFREVCRAIAGVYASAFSQEARTYAAGTPHLLEEQKMAVLVQQVVGQTYGDRYYPLLSGVAQSYNYYPIGNQRAEDGVAVIALGLGETVVSGRAALRFSPGAPSVLPQYPTAQAFLRGAQSHFYAVDLSRPTLDLDAGPDASLSLHDLADAEKDGTLALVGSVYCVNDDVIRDNLKLAGPRVATFRNILKWKALPLADALLELLRMLREAMGGEVEFEFAVDLANRAHMVSGPGKVPRLYLLQVRPLPSTQGFGQAVDLDDVPKENVFLRTNRALGDGRIDEIADIVYVRTDAPSPAATPKIAAEVGRLNAELRAADSGYMIIGPGRWGTSDPALGIPVAWSQIAGARVIVETAMQNRHVEHSQGTHFFQNVTARRIGYLTMAPDAEPFLDHHWLDTQPAVYESEMLRHVHLDRPLAVYLDGRRGRAVALKWAPELDPEREADLQNVF
jgi:CheY-like chemotaxis protein